MNGRGEERRAGWGWGRVALVGCAVLFVFGLVATLLFVTLNYERVRDLTATGVARIQELQAFSAAVEEAVPAESVAVNYDVRLENGEQTRTVFLDVVGPEATDGLVERLETEVLAAARAHLDPDSFERIVVRVVVRRTGGLVETSETVARLVIDAAAVAGGGRGTEPDDPEEGDDPDGPAAESDAGATETPGAEADDQ